MSGHHSLFSMTSIWQKKSEKQKVPLTPTELAISKHLLPVQGFLMQIRKQPQRITPLWLLSVLCAHQALTRRITFQLRAGI